MVVVVVPVCVCVCVLLPSGVALLRYISYSLFDHIIIYILN